MRHVDPAINVLNTGLSYGSVVRLKGSEYAFLQELRHIEHWHDSWQIYKYVGDFLEAPSKERLASTLTFLANYSYVEGDAKPDFEHWSLPWPILACVNSCSNRSDLLTLADKAAQGELGDAHDWVTAETRWFDKGITRDDLISMSDDRLPFDSRIGETGFPTTLSALKPEHYSSCV